MGGCENEKAGTPNMNLTKPDLDSQLELMHYSSGNILHSFYFSFLCPE